MTVRALGGRDALEAFRLEIERLARAHGAEVIDARVEPVEPRRRRSR